MKNEVIMMFKFCPRCGTKLVAVQIDGQQRMRCPKCNYINWSNETISVGGVVIKDNKMLLVQRAEQPGRGLWTNPGGYVEQREELKDAIVREIKEETGLATKAQKIVLIADSPGPKEHNVFINYRLDYVSGEFQLQAKEIMNAGFFTLSEMAKMNVADLTKQIVHLTFAHKDDRYTLTRKNVLPKDSNGFYLYC